MAEDKDYSGLFSDRYTDKDEDYRNCSVTLPPPPKVTPWPPEINFRNNRGIGNRNHGRGYGGYKRDRDYRDNYNGYNRGGYSYHRNSNEDYTNRNYYPKRPRRDHADPKFVSTTK